MTDGDGRSDRESDRTHTPASDPGGSSLGATDEDRRSSGNTWVLFARDLVTSVLAVLVVGALLFAVSGVWPPLVAIESGSMHPNMEQNDLVFVMDEQRFPGEGAVNGTGVVTAEAGTTTNYTMFENPGDVIVYRPDGNADRVPIIHRAMLHVQRGENWAERANPEYLGGASSCDELRHCPANRTGFITKGDANGAYDQVVGHGAGTETVDPAWVVGTAEVRVPGVGWLRLRT